MKTYGVIEQVTRKEKLEDREIITRNGHIEKDTKDVRYSHTNEYCIKFEGVYSKEFEKLFYKIVAEHGGDYGFDKEQGKHIDSKLPVNVSSDCWCGFMTCFMIYARFERKHVTEKRECFEIDWDDGSFKSYIAKLGNKDLIFNT